MTTATQEYAIDDGRIRISFEERAEVEGSCKVSQNSDPAATFAALRDTSLAIREAVASLNDEIERRTVGATA